MQSTLSCGGVQCLPWGLALERTLAPAGVVSQDEKNRTLAQKHIQEGGLTPGIDPNPPDDFCTGSGGLLLIGLPVAGICCRVATRPGPPITTKPTLKYCDASQSGVKQSERGQEGRHFANGGATGVSFYRSKSGQSTSLPANGLGKEYINFTGN